MDVQKTNEADISRIQGFRKQIISVILYTICVTDWYNIVLLSILFAVMIDEISNKEKILYLYKYILAFRIIKYN